MLTYIIYNFTCDTGTATLNILHMQTGQRGVQRTVDLTCHSTDTHTAI